MEKSTETLSGEEAAAYWEQRHRTHNFWAAGGHRSWDKRTNETFYYVRLGLLLRLLLNRFGPKKGLRILDAGCGRGWLTGQLKALGYDVVGVDQSAEAVRRAQRTYPAEFFLAALHEFSPNRQFDAIVSMDVLYHLTDDEQWEQSLRNLSQLLTQDGVFIFSAMMGDDTQVLGNYIVHRSRKMHERLLADVSLTPVASDTYNFLDSKIGWHMFARGGI